MRKNQIEMEEIATSNYRGRLRILKDIFHRPIRKDQYIYEYISKVREKR